ncbi:MAG: beta-propeller fold lactonase family protein [Terriglobales bacterium]
MKLVNRILFLALAAIAMWGWAGCGGGGCPTTSFGSSTALGATARTSTAPRGCSSSNTGGGSVGNTAAFLYYVGTNDILGASLSTTGTFSALTSVTPPTLPSSVGNDMIIVNKKFLYLPQSDSLTIQAFTIDHTAGALTAVPGSPFSTAGANSVASDPAGRFLFVGNDTTGQISVFQINSTTGALTPAPGSPFSAFNLDFVHVLAVDGTGTFLYVGQGLASLPIYAFSIDQNTGALSSTVGSPFTLGVAGVRTDFTGKFAIGLTGTTGDNHLYVFAIDPTTGALTAVSNSPFATVAATPLNLRIHPTSQFVYSFGLDSNAAYTAIEGFSIDPTTGELTALPNSPFTTLPVAGDCKWDQGGAEGFCSNATTSAFSVLDTNTSTGALSHTVVDLSVASDAVPFAPTD